MKWFKHDSDANRDPKLEKVLMRYGAEGYALYWMCIELIAAPIDKHNLTFELKHDSEILAYRLKMDSTKVQEIMNYMTSLKLFEINATTKLITCFSLAARLENSIVKNPQLKEIQTQIQQIIPDNPGQVRKSSARSRSDLDLDLKTLEQPFETFWSAYPKKRNIEQARKAWKKLNADSELQQTIILAVEKAKQTEDWRKEKGQYVPYPSTWINAKGWLDEYDVSVTPIKSKSTGKLARAAQAMEEYHAEKNTSGTTLQDAGASIGLFTGSGGATPGD